MSYKYSFRNILLNSFGGGYWMPDKLRVLYYNSLGLNIDVTARINARNTIYGRKLTIDEKAFVNYENYFDCTDEIHIGKNVWIGMRCTFITSSHEIENCQQRAGKIISAPININDGCWIGANVTILPGTVVGVGTVVAAGAVVTKDCDPNSLYAGIPAKKIRELDK